MDSREKAASQAAPGRLLPLSDEHWRLIAVAIDPDADIAGRTKLPNGQSLRDGFQVAISRAVKLAAEPTAGKIRAEVRHCSRVILRAYSRMSPAARELWLDEVHGWSDLQEAMPESLQRIEEWLSSTKDEKPIDSLLTNVVWLVCQCPDVIKTLPGKQTTYEAKKHPLVRTARAAVEVALALAERHESAAAVVLRRIRRCKTSVLVEHLRRARQAHSILPVHFPSP
jgi:thioester reductase-like protein